MWYVDKSHEDPTKCIRRVADDTGFHFYQCTRKRVDGKLCRQHAKQEAARDKRKEPYDSKK